MRSGDALPFFGGKHLCGLIDGETTIFA